MRALERWLLAALAGLMVVGMAFVVVESALGNTPTTATIVVLVIGVSAALALVLVLDARSPRGGRGSLLSVRRRRRRG